MHQHYLVSLHSQSIQISLVYNNLYLKYTLSFTKFLKKCIALFGMKKPRCRKACQKSHNQENVETSEVSTKCIVQIMNLRDKKNNSVIMQSILVI